MGVDQAKPQVIQTSRFYQRPHFMRLGDAQVGQQIQQRKRSGALLKRSECKFRNDERVRHDLSLAKTLAHFLVAGTEVVDPDRCVGEDQSLPA